MTISHTPARTPSGLDGRYTLEAAYAHCARVTRNHYENFPVASRLLPQGLRPHVCAIYAFARAADDFADETGYEGERLALLDEWEGRLDACLVQPGNHPVFLALADTIRCFDLPVDLLRDLLTAFRRDVTTPRHDTFDDLLEYCRYSANPVGRIVLRLFGLPDPALAVLSDRICSALQLANFWQDVAEDFRKGRIYLPMEDMRESGVSEEDLRLGRHSPGFADLLRHQISRTRDLFRQGLPLIAAPHPRLVQCDRPDGDPLRDQASRSRVRHLLFELRLTWLGGVHILDRIEAMNCDVLNRRPTVRRRDWAALIWKAWRFRQTAT